MFYVIPDIVESRKTIIKLVTMLYVITNTLLKVSLNTNKTVRHIIHNSWNIVDSGVNTNKNGHHVLHYTWHIVESVAKHQ